MVLVLCFFKRRARVRENFFLLKFFYSHCNIHLVWQIKYGKNMIRKLVTLILLVVIILIREQTIVLKPMSNTLETSRYWNKSRNTRRRGNNLQGTFIRSILDHMIEQKHIWSNKTCLLDHLDRIEFSLNLLP